MTARFAVAARVLALCCLAAPAGAQTTFENLSAEGLPTVYVTDRGGQETTGQLVSFTESVLVLKVDAATRTFTPSEVSLVERKGDSLKNGTIIGAALGLVASGALAGETCPSKRSCVGSRIGFTLFGTALYAAIGAGVDALIPGRTRIWPARKR